MKALTETELRDHEGVDLGRKCDLLVKRLLAEIWRLKAQPRTSEKFKCRTCAKWKPNADDWSGPTEDYGECEDDMLFTGALGIAPTYCEYAESGILLRSDMGCERGWEPRIPGGWRIVCEFKDKWDGGGDFDKVLCATGSGRAVVLKPAYAVDWLLPRLFDPKGYSLDFINAHLPAWRDALNVWMSDPDNQHFKTDGGARWLAASAARKLLDFEEGDKQCEK